MAIVWKRKIEILLRYFELLSNTYYYYFHLHSKNWLQISCLVMFYTSLILLSMRRRSWVWYPQEPKINSAFARYRGLGRTLTLMHVAAVCVCCSGCQHSSERLGVRSNVWFYDSEAEQWGNPRVPLSDKVSSLIMSHLFSFSVTWFLSLTLCAYAWVCLCVCCYAFCCLFVFNFMILCLFIWVEMTASSWQSLNYLDVDTWSNRIISTVSCSIVVKWLASFWMCFCEQK